MSADPTNHLPPLLVALDATFTIRGSGGERTVPADEFFVGVYMTAVGEGELLTKVSVPPSSGAGDGFAGLTIGKHGTYIANAAATVSDDGVRIALGCVDAVPVRATAMEEKLAGGDFSEDAVRAAAEGLGASLDPPSDVARVGRLPAPSRRGLGDTRGPAGGREAEGRSVGARTEPRRSRVDVNGEQIENEVPARRLLVHFIRDDLGLTGTHVGCDTGNCGACTVHLDGEPVKSCMLLAVQADGARITTVEGLAADGELTALQRRSTSTMRSSAATARPGMLMSATALLERNPQPERGGGPGRAAGEHLPLHGLREHRRGGRRGGGSR